MKKLVWFSFIAMLLVAVWTNNAQAGPIKLSNDTIDGFVLPQLDNEGRVVWIQNNDNQRNVMYYDGQKTNKIASGNQACFNRGKIVWADGDFTTGYKIMLYDGQNIRQIATSKYTNGAVINDEGIIYWKEDPENDYTYNLFMYDGQKVNELGPICGYFAKPFFHNGKGYWTSTGFNIVMYDGQKVNEITTGWNNNIGYLLCNGKLACVHQVDKEGNKIFLYDGQKISEIGKCDFNWAMDYSNGNLAWTKSNQEGVGQLNYYDGKQTRQIAAGNKIQLFDIDNGSIVWKDDQQLYIYKGQQVKPIKINNYVRREEFRIQNGTMTWVDRNDAQAQLYYYDGQEARQIASAANMDLIGLDNGKIVWRQCDNQQYKLCVFDGRQAVTVSNLEDPGITAGGDPSLDCIAFKNGRIAYLSPDRQLYLYTIGESPAEPEVVEQPAAPVTPPVLDYDSLKNATEAQVIDALDKSYQKLSDAQKQDSDSIEAITKYSEFGISQILKSQAAINNGQIAIDKNTLTGQEAKASATKAKIEQEMAKYKLELNRDLQTEILLQSPQWKEQAVSVVADKNLSEPSSKIDSIRIEGQEAGVVFNVDALKEELTASGTLTVQIEKENNTTASSGQLLASLDKNTPYLAFKLNLPSFKVSLNNGLQNLKNNIKIILPKAKGDTDYQAVFKADGDNSEAIGGKYNQASDRIEIPIKESGRYYVADNQKDFTDIQNKPEEVQKAIKVLASKGIIKGRSESNFDPNASISRSEIAALMVKTLYKLDRDAAAGFSDVPSSAWYYSYAASAKNHSIINGYPDNTFRGGIVINKEQITAVCARTMREEKHYKQPSNIETYLKYNDQNSISGWARSDVSLASREGLVVKRQDGNFLGSQGMTRADAALVLYRLFNRL